MKQNITTILKITSHFCLFTFAVLVLASCTPTEPQNNAAIIITAEDASCTEAWINLKLTSRIALPTAIKLFKNDSLVTSETVNSKDTTLFVENLLPNQTYSFYTTIEQLSNEAIKSNNLHITTMDTTSHDFIWESFTFGGVNGSSYLKDVAIINENDIWAVGEIHTAETDRWNEDSTKWVQPYNVVHWNGQKWELKRIMFYTFCNQGHKAPYEARAIFHFSDDITAITSGSQITYLENGIQKRIDCIPVSVNSIWGISSKDFYVVGQGGNIAHYNGSSWEKIESGTDLDFYDIYGQIYNDVPLIYAVAAKQSVSSDKAIVQIKNNSVKHLAVLGIPFSIRSIWFKPDKLLFIVGSGMYKKYNLTSTSSWIPFQEGITKYYLYSIDGENYNNIIACGSFGELLYFNGLNWVSYRNITSINAGALLSVKIKKNTIVAVGYDNPKAKIFIGRK